MTPREPDRFDKLREHPIFRYVPPEARETVADLLAAALRQAADEALERAAQEYGAEDLANVKVYCRHVAQRLRELKSPAAAPAPPLLERCRHDEALDEAFGKSPAAAPAAEGPNSERRICPVCQRGYWRRGSQEGERCGAADCFSHSWNDSEPVAPSLLPRVLAALESVGRGVVLDRRGAIELAAELRRYIADVEAGHAEAPDAERDRNRHNAMLVEAWREEFSTLCKVLFPGNDGPIGWKHVQAKVAALAKAKEPPR